MVECWRPHSSDKTVVVGSSEGDLSRRLSNYPFSFGQLNHHQDVVLAELELKMARVVDSSQEMGDSDL